MNTKILFVDDEANVLSGLRRMLRGQRNVWDMHFAGSGAEALDVMQQHAFDVIVSDMRMPGIDGAELLTRVSQLYPNTVRLVLSGQSEHEMIFRAIGPAHQFLSKPCDPEVLINTIVRACGLHTQMDDQSLRDLISQIRSLPSLPRIYRDLLIELKSDDASVERVAEMISSDLAMTAKVLQLVNSSFFGLPQHVACPQHAVSLLGLNIIRPLVLSAGAFCQFDDPQLDGYSLDHSIHHSLAVATVARRIAVSETTDHQVIDDAFLAGMMHDIGKLVLAVNLPERYQEALSWAQQNQIPLWQAEKYVLGASHAEVGAHLLALWGLPHPIVEAVAFHHRPGDANHEEFCPMTAVHASNLLHQQGDTDNGTAFEDPSFDYLRKVGFADRFDAWASLVATELPA